jgi:hypothetical protein
MRSGQQHALANSKQVIGLQTAATKSPLDTDFGTHRSLILLAVRSYRYSPPRVANAFKMGQPAVSDPNAQQSRPPIPAVAGPIRFRHPTDSWTQQRVDSELLGPLDGNLGARRVDPRNDPPPEYQACLFEMDNGDIALFCWHEDSGAYWLGNTETPRALWRTEKYTFDEIPYPVARWAQRELLARLEASDPWLATYDHIAWFFLPVFFSKDGRETTRSFFRDHEGGFPDATREDALEFYEALLSTGILDDHRYTMATKLGTSERLDLVRMRASMAELHAAKLLADGGHEFVPEVELDSGYALDFRVLDTNRLVEVTRPEPPTRRRAGTPAAALRETVDGKTSNQLAAHPNAVVFVDSSSFRDDEWQAIAAERPEVGHNPGIVYRVRPDGSVAGYSHGDHGLSLQLSP